MDRRADRRIGKTRRKPSVSGLHRTGGTSAEPVPGSGCILETGGGTWHERVYAAIAKPGSCEHLDLWSGVCCSTAVVAGPEGYDPAASSPSGAESRPKG